MVQAGRRRVAADFTLGHFAPHLNSIEAQPAGPSGQSKTNSSTSPLQQSPSGSRPDTQEHSSDQSETAAAPLSAAAVASSSPAASPLPPAASSLLAAAPSSAAHATAVSQMHPLLATHTSAKVPLLAQAGPNGREQGFQQPEATHCVSSTTLARESRQGSLQPMPGLFVHSSGQFKAVAAAPSAATVTARDSRYL